MSLYQDIFRSKIINIERDFWVTVTRSVSIYSFFITIFIQEHYLLTGKQGKRREHLHSSLPLSPAQKHSYIYFQLWMGNFNRIPRNYQTATWRVFHKLLQKKKKETIKDFFIFLCSVWGFAFDRLLIER